MSQKELAFAGGICIFLMLLLIPAAPGASLPPPPIADLVGTYQVNLGGTLGALDTGAIGKHKSYNAWRITLDPVNPDVVLIDGVSDIPGGATSAVYKYGCLFFGFQGDGNLCSCTGYVKVSGAAGKIALQGQIIVVGSDSWPLMFADAIKAKQTSTSTALAVPCDDPAGAADAPQPIQAKAKTVAPPTIEELDGTSWDAKFAGKGLDFAAGGPASESKLAHWYMTGDAVAGTIDVEVTYDNGDPADALHFRYYSGEQGGILVMASGDIVNNPALKSINAQGSISGKPGAYKISVAFLDYTIDGSGDNVEAGTISAKEVAF